MALLEKMKADFLDTNLQISFVVQDKKGNNLLTMNKDLFNLVHQLEDSGGKIVKWSKSDWNCQLRYGDRDIDSRVIPFSINKKPIQSELLCWVLFKTPPFNSKILLKCENIEPGYDLKASLKLSSGWK